MNRLKVVEDNYLGGLNCCQSVIGTFAEEFGLDKQLALKISSGFGGGLKQGEVCGVVTGALMALGLKYGNHDPEDQLSKDRIKELTLGFQTKFKERYGSVLCKDLLGYDVSIEEDAKYCKENNISKQVCPKYVIAAVEIVEELLK